MQKRNTAVDLTDLALGITILGITVVIGARLLITYRDNRLTDLSTSTTYNETTTVVNETGVQLANTWVEGVTYCGNTTTTDLFPVANYSLSVDSVSGVGTLTYTGVATYPNNSLWNCTYTTYNISEPQWDLPNNAALGLAEYGNWFDIIVIVGIAGLILSLIFLAFGNRGQEVGVSY